MSLIFSQKALCIGLDRFVSGESSKLLVVGLSGAGKTMLGKKLAAKYMAEYVNLDGFFFSHQQLKRTAPHEYIRQRTAYELSQFDGHQKMVLDGVAIMRMPESVVMQFPVIILRTSLIHSSWRGFKRNLKEKLTDKNPFIDAYTAFVKNIGKYRHEIDSFTARRLALAKERKEVIEEVAYNLLK